MKYLLNIFFLFVFYCSISQTTYNTFTLEDQWWQPDAGKSSKEFIKISIGENGIYRVYFSDLLNEGFTYANESEIQLYRRGIEQSIFISSGNYIEFYAEKNDGKLDSELYFPSDIQPNKYHSMFTDTSAYFLTSTTGAIGKRNSDFATTTGTSDTYHMQ